MAAEDAATACSVMPATVDLHVAVDHLADAAEERVVRACEQSSDVVPHFSPAPPSQTSLAKAEGTSDTREHAIALYGYGSDKCSIQYAHPIDQSAMYGKHSTERVAYLPGHRGLRYSGRDRPLRSPIGRTRVGLSAALLTAVALLLVGCASASEHGGPARGLTTLTLRSAGSKDLPRELQGAGFQGGFFVPAGWYVSGYGAAGDAGLLAVTVRRSPGIGAGGNESVAIDPANGEGGLTHR